MAEMTVEHKHMKMDRLGLLLSGLCLIHCIGTPILLILFPFIQSLEGLHSSFHWVSAIMLVPLAVLAVTQGYSHHRKRIVPLLAGIGATLVVAGALAPLFIHSDPTHMHDHDMWFTKDIIISIIGSVCLLACHSLNIYFCRNKSGSKPQCHSGH